MIETIKHLFGLCGESHLNMVTILLSIIILKFIYEKYFSKTFWFSRNWNSK
jgi:hypothetical protein